IRPRVLFPRAPRPRRHARGAGGADRRAAVLRRRGYFAELFLDRAWGEGQWGKGGEGSGRAERQATLKQRVYPIPLIRCVGASAHRSFLPPVVPCPGRSGTSTAKPRPTSQADST